jgi:hypothetical protein
VVAEHLGWWLESPGTCPALPRGTAAAAERFLNSAIAGAKPTVHLVDISNWHTAVEVVACLGGEEGLSPAIVEARLRTHLGSLQSILGAKAAPESPPPNRQDVAQAWAFFTMMHRLCDRAPARDPCDDPDD